MTLLAEPIILVRPSVSSQALVGWAGVVPVTGEVDIEIGSRDRLNVTVEK